MEILKTKISGLFGEKGLLSIIVRTEFSHAMYLSQFDMVDLSRAYHNLIAKNVYLQAVVKKEKKPWVLAKKFSFLRPCNVNSCMILQSVVTRDTFKPNILWFLPKTDL